MFDADVFFEVSASVFSVDWVAAVFDIYGYRLDHVFKNHD